VLRGISRSLRHTVHGPMRPLWPATTYLVCEVNKNIELASCDNELTYMICSVTVVVQNNLPVGPKHYIIYITK